ncbi:unnamed protein product [Clavelina lepadiformis]|uniref:Sodium-dependent multivitamin transporter n=1 Tax=Clavelina lepadiformis TaxID=159417 RepID=A0ABP0GUS6_CLALP
MSYTESSSGKFSTADFVVFIGMLAAAALVGIYYAIKDRKAKNQTLVNYNFGGRSMSAIPLGLSMAVSYISAITMISFPTEAYNYGAVVIWYSTTSIIPNVIAYFYYIPLVHKLSLYSIYQYLELRFDVKVRKLCSAISILQLICSLGKDDCDRWRIWKNVGFPGERRKNEYL